MKQKSINRWLILIAGCVINFSLSGTSAFSIFVKPVMEATSWSMSAITLAYTLYNFVLCITGIVVGTFAHKWKPWQIIYVGSIFFAAGWLVTGMAKSVLVMQLGFGVLAGIGGGFLYNYTLTNVLKWFPDRRGFASGLLLGCSAVGPVFCSPVATAILSNIGVFNAYKILGLIYASLLLLFGWLIHTPAPDYKPDGWQPEAAKSAVVATGKNMNWKQMLQTSTFYLLYLLYLLFVGACTSYMMMLNAAAVIGQERAGMSPAMAALSVTLLAISNFCGRMVFGTLSDKIGRYKTLMIALSINFVSMLAMAVVKSAIPFLVLMCLVGACGGALLVMFPPIVSERYGVKHSGLNYSIMFSAYSVASFVGPQIAAHYRSLGDYGPAFVWAACLTAAAFALLLIVMAQNKRRADC